MKRFRGCRGQSIAEYGFVLAFVAVIVVGTATGFGRRLNTRAGQQRVILEQSGIYTNAAPTGVTTNAGQSMAPVTR